MRQTFLFTTLLAASVADALDPQKPMTHEQRESVQAACPDYSTYSKYALQ
jgi:hypothetical protein